MRTSAGTARWMAVVVAAWIGTGPGARSQTTNVWDGGGTATSNSWVNATNWVGDIAYGADVVVFNSPGAANLSTTLGGDRNANLLAFIDDADSTVRIAGNTLRLFAPSGTGLVVTAGAAGNHFITSTLWATNNQTWSIETTAGSLSVGPVRGGPAYSVTKVGNGLLWITNSQVDLGNFVISNGTVRYASANGFNDNNTRVTVAAGAVLDKNNTVNDSFKGLIGAGAISNWVGELQLRPRSGDSFLFTGAAYQGTSAVSVRAVQDADSVSTALDGSDSGKQAFDTALPFTGQAQAHNGILAFQGQNGSMVNASRVLIGQNNRATRDPTFLLDSSSDNHTSNNRIGDTVGVYFDGPGQFKMIGNPSAATTETIGIITQNNGRAIITLDADAGGATILTAARWQYLNNGRATLIRGDNLGATAGPGVAQFFLTTAPTLSHVGGTGDQIGIVPMMAGDTNVNGQGAGLVTYGAGTGVRLLTAAEYSTSMAADRNVRLSGAGSIAAPTRIRALHLDAGSSLDLNGHRLIIDSQALFADGGTVTNGSIAFGTNATGTASTGHIHAMSNLTIGVSMVGLTTAGGGGDSRIAFAGPGTVTLAAPGTNWITLLTGGVTLKTAASEVIPEGAMANDEGHLWIGDGLKETIGYLRGNGKSQLTIGSGSTLTINQTNNDDFYGTINGDASSRLVKMGGGELNIRNHNTNFFGKVVVTNGIFQFLDQNGSMNASDSVQFFVTNAILEIDNQPGTDNAHNGDRINNESDIFLSAGTIIMRGSKNQNPIENTGDLFLLGGMSTNVMDRDNETLPDNNAGLQVNTFTRTNGATFFIRAERLSDFASNGWTRLNKDDNKVAPVMTHAYHTATNTPNVGIVHWAFGEEITAAAAGVQSNMGFVAYDDGGATDNGFRLLRPSEYNSTLDAGGNVWLANAGGTIGLYSNTTVQGLLYQKVLTNQTVLNLSNNVLWIQSALLVTGTNAGNTHEIRRTGAGGALMFGNANNNYEAVIHAMRRLDVYAPIMDNVDGGVTNSTTLIKSGTGELVLRTEASNSTYSGATYVNEGTLRLEGAGTTSYQNPRVIPTNTPVFINSRTATLEMYNAGQEVGALYGYGRVNLSSSVAYTNRFVVNYTNTAVADRFDGWITENAVDRTLDVVKRGDGTLIFTTAITNNTYKGDTIVEAGTLLMNGTHISPSNGTEYIVKSGATLGGTGLIRILSGVTIEGGGTLAPGASAGTLTLDTDLTLAPTSVLAYELDGTATTTGAGVNDLIDSVNNLTLDGILEVSALNSFAGAGLGDTWTLIRYDGTLLADNGLSISSGSQALLSGGKSFEVDVSVNNEIRLTVIPEPGSAGLIALGLAIAGWRRFRRLH
ncbi:MAG: hypothetical protein FJ221_13215 [Lentisphaerae bacterium]|nr:hypothetical protein [Lentisphaerota bacterium]